MGNECSNEPCCNNSFVDNIGCNIMFDSFEHHFDNRDDEIESEYCGKCKKSVNYPDFGLSDGSSSICECKLQDEKRGLSTPDQEFSFSQTQKQDVVIPSRFIENIQK